MKNNSLYLVRIVIESGKILVRLVGEDYVKRLEDGKIKLIQGIKIRSFEVKQLKKIYYEH